MKETVKQITTYECENCHKIFYSKEEATIHEQNCTIKNIPMKAIVLNSDNTVTIINYPDALYWRNEDYTEIGINLFKDKVNLMPKSHDSDYNHFFPSVKFRFGQIKEGNNKNLIIYTMNFNQKCEKKCISTLINYKIKQLEDSKVNIEKQISQTKEISKNSDNINIDIKKNFLAEYLSE